MKRVIFAAILILQASIVFAAGTALQVDFLLSGYQDPTSERLLAGGKVYTYLDGTSTLSNLWTDKDKGAEATNPIILDAAGKAEVYGDNIYKFEIYDSTDVLIETINGLEYKTQDAAGNFYYPDYNATDQGVTGDNNTIKYYVDLIGSDQATIVLLHNSGSSTTTYTLTTAETIPSNITLKVDRGAIVDGAGTLTFADGASIDALDYQIFGSSITVAGITEVKIEWFGGFADGSTDCSAAINSAIASLTSGGVLDGDNKEYIHNTANSVINVNNLYIRNIRFKRTSTLTGWLFNWATTGTTTGGGMINVVLEGNDTVSGGGAGVRMGSETTYANEWVLDNITAKSFAQYGVGVEAGNDWSISNIQVLEHGLTSGAISSCIGFYVYPKIASRGGQITNVYSEISDDCIANASANTAAIKLQTHRSLTASNITARGGSEEAMTIDSVNGYISDVLVVAQSLKPGMFVQNYNAAHSFSGQTFTLDGVEVLQDGTDSNYSFSISSGVDGQYALNGCNIKNIKARNSYNLNYTNFRNCVFENLTFGDMRWSATLTSTSANSAQSTNNTFRNIVVTEETGGGILAIDTDDSVLENIGLRENNGKTPNAIYLYGDSNICKDPYALSASGNAFTLNGDTNKIYNLSLSNVTGRSIWVQSGSNNIIYGGDLWEGVGMLDNGTGTLFYLNSSGVNKIFYGSATPVSGTYARGDKMYYFSPAAGGFIGEVCTVAGTPGTWKTFGVISP